VGIPLVLNTRAKSRTLSSPMPWKCPACQTQIAHEGDTPEPNRVYRCHVCRLELVLDDTTHRLTVTPVSVPVAHNRRATDRKP